MGEVEVDGCGRSRAASCERAIGTGDCISATTSTTTRCPGSGITAKRVRNDIQIGSVGQGGYFNIGIGGDSRSSRPPRSQNDSVNLRRDILRGAADGNWRSRSAGRRGNSRADSHYPLRSRAEVGGGDKGLGEGAGGVGRACDWSEGDV